MIMKSLLAGTVLASLAGGAVYFGLGEELATNVHPHGNTSKIERTDKSESREPSLPVSKNTKSSSSDKGKQDSSAEKTLKTMMGKTTKLADSMNKNSDLAGSKEEDPLATSESTTSNAPVKSETSDEKPRKRWLDEYLKSAPDGKPNSETSELETAANPNSFNDSIEVELNVAPALDGSGGVDYESDVDLTESMSVPKSEDLSSMSSSNPDRLDKTPETRSVIVEMETSENGYVKTKTRETYVIADQNADDAKIAVENVEIVISEPNSFGDHNGHIKAKVQSEINSIETNRDKVESQDDVIDILIAESAKLEIPDMRDDAYLNIVDYALSKGSIDVAKKILPNLSRMELRDTARGRVGVALANRGQVDAAFDILDDLEIEELQDPIRLQIIAAFTDQNIPIR